MKEETIPKNDIENVGERLTRSIHIDKNGCWIWQLAKEVSGYGHIGLPNRRVLKTHRVSWMLFRGPIPANKQVLHRCDVRSCVNPYHLFLGDPGINAIDRTMKARHPRHVSDETIIAIQKLDTCWSYKAIASTYKISRETAKRIVTRSRPRYREIYKAQQAGGKMAECQHTYHRLGGIDDCPMCNCAMCALEREGYSEERFRAMGCPRHTCPQTDIPMPNTALKAGKK